VNVRNDEETDLSVLYTDLTEFQPAQIGDSDKMEIGDFVVAIGSPFGLSHSVSYGIISATGRRDLELGPHGVRYQDFLQTDAAINPGNSGGPLINLRGEVIGINTAIASNSGGNDGIGFSIPIKMVMRVAKDLIDYGAVRRGFLGVSLDARFSPEVAQAMGLQKAYGARVSAITPDSPADKVDIMVGDIVLEYNGVPVANDSHLVTEVSMSTIGSEVPVKVFRHGKSMTVTVTIEDRDGFQVAPR
jgi:serine protease Do